MWMSRRKRRSKTSRSLDVGGDVGGKSGGGGPIGPIYRVNVNLQEKEKMLGLVLYNLKMMTTKSK
jgi:hypothetical protein